MMMKKTCNVGMQNKICLIKKERGKVFVFVFTIVLAQRLYSHFNFSLIVVVV